MDCNPSQRKRKYSDINFFIYQVCKGKSGKNTDFLQQQADCQERYKKVVNPRNRFCMDLQPIVRILIEKGHKVITCRDVNDDAELENNNQCNRMISQQGMIIVLQAMHKGVKLPKVYKRGRRVLNQIAISPNIKKSHIIRAEIPPLYTTTASGYRAPFIDINIHDLYDGDSQQDVLKHTFQRFIAKTVKKSRHILTHYQHCARKQKLDKKYTILRNKLNFI